MRFSTLAVLLLVSLLSPASFADVITVDGAGGEDYLTIQEAVDAASWGDTVLVYPGTYTGNEMCGSYDLDVALCLRTGLTLRSVEGPDVTVIDGGGTAMHGILSDAHVPVVVEGFTIRNGSGPNGWGVAVAVRSGEVRGNVIEGFGTGVSTDWIWYAGGGAERCEERDVDIVITGNTFTGGNYGVYVTTWSGRDAVIADNTVSGCTQSGVRVYGTGNVSLVGNEVSGNEMGVVVRNPSHTAGAQFSVELLSNRIWGNVDTNVDVHMSEIGPGTVCDVTIGGSMGDANDIHDAPINLSAMAWDVDVDLDASYNFWGSISCSTVISLLDIHESLPDSQFVFEPFLDPTHTVLHDCAGVAVEDATWGSIKALYR